MLCSKDLKRPQKPQETQLLMMKISEFYWHVKFYTLFQEVFTGGRILPCSHKVHEECVIEWINRDK